MKRKLLANVVLLIVTLALSLVLAEWAVRYALRDITTTSDNRSYFALKWKAANVQRNSYGFREREFLKKKADGAYRILFIGDSFTFGQGIAEKDRMSNLLQDRLRHDSPSAEVLNFGNPGNNTEDELKLLRAVLNDLEPDYIILQWFWNDVEIGSPVAGGRRSGAFIKFKTYMRNQSALYFLVAESWHGILERGGWGRANDLLERFGNPDSEASRRADDSLIEFIQTAKKHAVPMAVVLVPQLAAPSESGYPYDYLYERVKSLCRRERVPYIDLQRSFAPHLATSEGARRLWVNRFDSHMGPEANRIAAEELFRALGPLWTRPSEPSIVPRQQL